MLDPRHISDPGGAISAVLMLTACLIFGSFPAIRMIGWWSEGTIDGGMAFIAICLYVGLLISATMLPLFFGIIILVVLLSSAILVPAFSKVSETHQLKTIDKERIQRYTDALERNPMDHAARLAYAEALYKEGDHEEAITHMEWLLSAAPSLSMRVRPQLESWRRAKERIGMRPPIICHRCHAENPFNAEICENCSVAFGTVRGMKQSIHYDGGPKVVIRAWLVSATAIMVAIFTIVILPSIIAGPIILGTIIVSVWLFLRWVGGDMGTIGD